MLPQKKSKWTQTKTKHNYDTRTKQLSNEIKINKAKHNSKLEPKVDRCNTAATTLVDAKRSRYDVPINSPGVGRTRP